MEKLRWFLILMLVLHSSAFAQLADPADPKVSFEAGNQAYKLGNLEEALEHYEASFEAGGDSPNLFWNAGNVAQRLGKEQEALKFFTLLKDIDPEDYRTLAKLVQCYQRLGLLEERDRTREQLYALWKESAQDSEIRQRSMFCRDLFSVGDHPVMVFEHFELESPRGVKYVFLVLQPDQEKEEYRISLGSYDATNAIFHEMDKIEASVRVYHLDGYYNEGRKHSTFRFFEGLPDYEALKAMVKSIVVGDLKPVSGSETKGDGEIEISLPLDE